MVTGTADTACTFQWAKETGVFFLLPISHYSVYNALLVWLVVLIGLIRRLMEHRFSLRSQLLPKRWQYDTR